MAGGSWVCGEFEANLDAQVAYIEADTAVYASALVEQTGSQLGLNRISHEDLGSTTYVFDDTMGAGVTVYIIDTGVLPTHSVSLDFLSS